MIEITKMKGRLNHTVGAFSSRKKSLPEISESISSSILSVIRAGSAPAIN